MSSDLLRQANARVHHAQGALNFHLDVFGDEIAEREGYQEYTGIEAVQFYLMTKHGWLPRDVRTMSYDDMRFALGEEMFGWTVPSEALGVYPG